MSDTHIPSPSAATDDRRALEDLVVDNPDLERLEALVGQFNLFEALGVERHELRHSDFLAFLLDPRGTHAAGTAFLKRFLQRVLQANPDRTAPVTPLELDLLNLGGATVHREWHSIDVAVLVEAERLAVVCENKIDTEEHSDQLGRYLGVVDHERPGWRVLPLYLTPDGTEPSHPAYLAADYGLVCEVVEGFLDTRPATLTDDVRVVVAHYAQMLRRHIVSESEVADLCRRIYRRHQRALDLIFEHRPDQQAVLADALAARIAATPDLALDRVTKGSVTFAAADWDQTLLTGGRGWTPSGRVLLFQFRNDPKRLRLSLHLGPGPLEVRERLFERLQRPPFRPSSRGLGDKWNSVWQREFLRPSKYEEADSDELVREVNQQWEQFVSRDLPVLRGAVAEERWLWPDAAVAPGGTATGS